MAWRSYSIAPLLTELFAAVNIALMGGNVT
jgi:hypothetical protein